MIIMRYAMEFFYEKSNRICIVFYCNRHVDWIIDERYFHKYSSHIYIFVWLYELGEPRSTEGRQKACTLRCATFWWLKFAKCSWIEDKVLNRPFCSRVSRFTTSIRSDRAEMYQFFRHEIGGRNYGQNYEKNIKICTKSIKIILYFFAIMHYYIK